MDIVYYKNKNHALNKVNVWGLIRNNGVRKQWDDIFKMLKETFIYQDTHIQKFLAITLQAQSNQNILDRKS